MLSVVRNDDRHKAPKPLENFQRLGQAPEQPIAGFINDFMTQLTEPAMIPAFLAGGMAYRALRWGAAGKWVASPAVRGLSGLFGRQFAASTLALAGETAVFTGAHRAASGLTQHWRGAPPVHPSLFTEMAGTGIMLASLRSFGFGFGMLGAALQRAGLCGAGTAFLLSQAGSYTGLLTAGQLEHRLLHPEIPGMENPYLSAAVSLIHFTGFNLMARHITPHGWRRLEETLEQKTLRLIEQKVREIREGFPPQFGIGGGNWAWQGAIPSTAPAGTAPGLPRDFNTPGLFAIKGPPEPPDSGAFWSRVPEMTRTRALDIDQQLGTVDRALTQTLAGTALKDLPRIDLALRRLHYLLKFAQPDNAQSSYINWITRLGLQRILENRDSAALDRMITLITQSTARPDYEAFLGELFPEGSFSRHPVTHEPFSLFPDNLFPNHGPHAKAISGLSLGIEAEQTLRLWLRYQDAADGQLPFFLPQQTFLGLLGHLEKLKDLPKWRLVASIIEQAEDSPVGRLKLYRLFKILQAELEWVAGPNHYEPRGLLGTKLRELADAGFNIAEPLPGLGHDKGRIGFRAGGAYLGFHGPEGLLRMLLPRISKLTDPDKEQRRLHLRRQVMAKVLKQYPGELGYRQSNLATAFFELGLVFDRENWTRENQNEAENFAIAAARDLKRADFTLEVLPEAAYARRYHGVQRRYHNYHGLPYREQAIDHRSYIFYPEHRNQIAGLEQPIILVQVPDYDRNSLNAYKDHYFEIMKGVIHEWTHLKQMERYKQGKWNEGAHLKQEAAAHTTHAWFAAQHGDAAELRTLASNGLGGYMMALLDYLEVTYKKNWRGQ